MKYLFYACILGFFAKGQVLPPNVPSSGLVAWFPFNGNANDESGNGFHGTANSVTSTQDRFGNPNAAYEFNGFSSHINLLDIDFPQRTVSLWFHPLQYPTGNQQAIVFSNDHHLLVNGMSHIGLVGTDLFGNFGHGLPNAPNHCVTPTDNIMRWYSIIVSKDADTTRYYFDGNLVCKRANGNLKSTANVVPAVTRVGTSRLFERWYRGYIDDIGIWNRALTEAEIMNLLTPCTEGLARQPLSVTVSHTAPGVSFVCKSTDTTAGYEWEVNTGLGWTRLLNVAPFFGVNQDSLYISPVSAAMNNYSFRCVVTTYCNTKYSDVATLTITGGSVGLNDVHPQISVYPNPTTDQIKISGVPVRDWTRLEIVDVVGAVHHKEKIKSTTHEVSLRHLARGIYFAHIYFDEQNSKVIKIILN